MNKVSISVQGLSKNFRRTKNFKTVLRSPFRSDRIEVLREINLTIFEGEVFGLLGANGVGKTTFLEILSTLLLPTSGRVWVGGYELVRQSAQVRRIVGYCPAASQSFYPRLSGLANLQFFASLNNLPPRKANENIATLLDLVGIDGTRNAIFQCYSEGMKQRLSLARALLSDPSILLLDEPTKSLDPLLQQGIQRFLRRTVVEEMGKTVLLVTHSLAEAEEVCDRVAIIDQGRILSVGKPSEVKGLLGRGRWARAAMRAAGGER